MSDVVGAARRATFIANLEKSGALKEHDRRVRTKALMEHGLGLAIGNAIALWIYSRRRRG